jgi:hypothetical protein
VAIHLQRLPTFQVTLMEALMVFGLVIPRGMTPLFANKLFYWSFFDFSWLDW